MSQKDEETELIFAIEACFDDGKNVEETLAALNKTGDIRTEKKCLELLKVRQLQKQARFKRFGSVAHLLPGRTKADDFSQQWLGGMRSTPNVSWHMERDAPVEDRLNAPLPAPRERPLPPIIAKDSTESRHHLNRTWSLDSHASVSERLDSALPVSRGYAINSWPRGRFHGANRGYGRGHAPAYANSSWVNPDIDDDNASTYTTPSINSRAQFYRIDHLGDADDDFFSQ